MCWATLQPAAAAPELPMQTVHLHVAVPESLQITQVVAEVQRLGETHQITLLDDGKTHGDVAHDGVWFGTLTGPNARYLQVGLYGTWNGTVRPLYQGLVRTDKEVELSLGWRVRTKGETLQAQRLPVTIPNGIQGSERGLTLQATMGWGAFLLIYGGIALLLSRKPRTT